MLFLANTVRRHLSVCAVAWPEERFRGQFVRVCVHARMRIVRACPAQPCRACPHLALRVAAAVAAEEWAAAARDAEAAWRERTKREAEKLRRERHSRGIDGGPRVVASFYPRWT